jgi:hypothetical protein
MKKLSPIVVKLFLNIITSLILTITVLHFSPDKYLKTIGFEILPKTNASKFLTSMNYPIELKFFEYVKIVDREIRVDKSKSNLCEPIISESGSLPVQFSYKQNFIFVNIVSKSRDIIEKCSDQISTKLNGYNKFIQDELLAKYNYKSLILNKIKATERAKKREKKDNKDLFLNLFDEENSDQLENLRYHWMLNFRNTVDGFNDLSKNTLSKDNILKLEWLTSVMSLLVISNETRRSREELFIPKIPKNIFKNIVTELKFVELSSDRIVMVNKPNFYLVFLSIFTIIILLYILFYKIFNIKKYKKIIFNLLK